MSLSFGALLIVILISLTVILADETSLDDAESIQNWNQTIASNLESIAEEVHESRRLSTVDSSDFYFDPALNMIRMRVVQEDKPEYHFMEPMLAVDTVTISSEKGSSSSSTDSQTSASAWSLSAAANRALPLSMQMNIDIQTKEQRLSKSVDAIESMAKKISSREKASIKSSEAILAKRTTILNNDSTLKQEKFKNILKRAVDGLNSTLHSHPPIASSSHLQNWLKVQNKIFSSANSQNDNSNALKRSESARQLFASGLSVHDTKEALKSILQRTSFERNLPTSQKSLSMSHDKNAHVSRPAQPRKDSRETESEVLASVESIKRRLLTKK